MIRTRDCVMVIASACLMTVSCERINRGKQVRAQADLQYLVAMIERSREITRAFPRPTELQRVVGPDRLEDPWGNAILYGLTTEGGQEHYVLVCVGADGRLDEASLENYVDASARDVSYEMNSDIVVVDGKFVRNAGK